MAQLEEEKHRAHSPIGEDEEKIYDRRPLKLGGFKLLGLAFSTLGIIYSDIGTWTIVFQRRGLLTRLAGVKGTSPLYVLNGIWPASGNAPDEADVIGGISAIVWSLTLLPLLKYASPVKLPRM